MKTCAEQLPIEIWISIFQHFEIHDLLYAFNNLNRYFNEILSSDHLLLHVQLEKCEQFYRQLAFFSPWPSSILNRIVYLKSSTQGHGKYLSQFLYWHGSQLLRLKSLTIEVNRQELRPNSIEYLSCQPIEYLSIACVPTEDLLQAILSSSKLYKCRLYFWPTNINNLNSTVQILSEIRILFIKLKDGSNHSLTHYLLSNMPNLKRLEIVADHVHEYLTKSISILSKLERLKLTWLRRSMSIDYFDDLLTILPNIEYISLGFYYFRLSESFFENLLDRWWSKFDRIRFVELFIRSNGLGKLINSNEHHLFDDYCRKTLTRINSRNDVYFNIKWIEENPKIHSIIITIKKC